MKKDLPSPNPQYPNKETINEYQQAIIEQPGNNFLYYMLSIYYYKVELYKFLDTAIMLNPAKKEYFQNRGTLYYMLQNDEKALKDFNIVIQMDSTFIPVYESLLFLYYYRERDLDKAEEMLQKFDYYRNLHQFYPIDIQYIRREIEFKKRIRNIFTNNEVKSK